MKEQHSKYLEQVTAESDSRKGIVTAILKFMKESFIDENIIKVTGCDATASNAGVYL